jgi:hypothetical protein
LFRFPHHQWWLEATYQCATATTIYKLYGRFQGGDAASLRALLAANRPTKIKIFPSFGTSAQTVTALPTGASTYGATKRPDLSRGIARGNKPNDRMAGGAPIGNSTPPALHKGERQQRVS